MFYVDIRNNFDGEKSADDGISKESTLTWSHLTSWVVLLFPSFGGKIEQWSFKHSVH